MDEVRTLLKAMNLPADDIGDPAQTFIIARVGDRIVGSVGLEQCGRDALLRSLAVDPAWRRGGVGTELHARAVAESKRRGVGALFLLTTTAAPFFARLGYDVVDRATVPEAVAATSEFRTACPASATCMRWTFEDKQPSYRDRRPRQRRL
jgi:amino-acid N-acetyltransferase